MFRNYYAIAWRNIIRAKGFSILNITGLAAGMAVAILIGLWVADELRYNRSFEHYDRIAQVYHHITFGEERMTINDVPAPMGEVLKNEYDWFEKTSITSWPQDHLVSIDDVKAPAKVLFVDPHFPEIFSVKPIEGARLSADNFHNVLLSQSFATTLGGSLVGKTVLFNNRDLLMVTGVYEDFPANSEFSEVKMLVPIAYLFRADSAARRADNWEDYSFQCFALLQEEKFLQQAETDIKRVLFDHASNDGKALNPEAILLPMRKWHLESEFKNGSPTGAQTRSIWMFSTIGFFVLLLACINFINLSTARSEKRAKEIGIRKAIGSHRGQLIIQFLSESFLLVFISFVLAVLIALISLESFNVLSGKKLVIPWLETDFILATTGFLVITGVLAGIYPALFLSSFHPARVLKGGVALGRRSTTPRKVLVIFQFITSMTLIIGTAVVFLQIRHGKDRPVGFDRSGIFHLAIRTDDLANSNYNSIRRELLSTGVVSNVALSDFPVTGPMRGDASVMWEGRDPSVRPLITMNSCSHDFPATCGFQFIEGRDFSREHSTDSLAVIINELAARLIAGNESAIGKKISFGYGKEREVVGVIKDQIRWTPFVEQTPHMYYIDYSSCHYFTIRLSTGAGTTDALKTIESVVRKFDDGAPFEFMFLDDDYARLFRSEERTGKIAGLFTILAVVISCLGMFGLAAFAASRRTKEIGIRKVLGASVAKIWGMLSIDFLRLVVVALAVGTPLSWFLSEKWLQQYEYRITLSWMTFLMAGALVVVVALFSVSYQAIKAALLNPVDSLRSE